jgi:hypothetical protein
MGPLPRWCCHTSSSRFFELQRWETIATTVFFTAAVLEQHKYRIVAPPSLQDAPWPGLQYSTLSRLSIICMVNTNSLGRGLFGTPYFPPRIS